MKSFLRGLISSGRVLRAARVLDLASKIYVSLTDAQKAQMMAVLTPEQMMIGVELMAAWEKLKEDKDDE